MRNNAWIGKLCMMSALLLACAGQVWAVAPQAVSPGSVDRLVEINTTCPTFSWGAEADRSYYEIVTYVLDEQIAVADLQETDLGEWNEVLYTTVPGGATSWTPAIDQQLASGGRYVWFVRGVSVDADGELVEAGEWSRGNFFSLPDRPTEQQFRQALELIQKYMVAQGNSAAHVDPPTTPRRGSEQVQQAQESDSDDSTPPLRSVLSAMAAIRGELPDTSGESYGIVGASSSPDGAGLAAVNTAGGADLVLDGSLDSSATDTEIRESGIYRSSPTDELFTFSNPGAGTLTLDVNGNLDAMNITALGVFTGDGSGLTGITHTEADPVFLASDAAGVTVTLTTSWNTAFAWGDHSTQGYLTTFTETDPIFGAAPAHGITAADILNWTVAYSWGNHAAVGYDTSADSWLGTGAYASTPAMVGVGMAGAPSTMLHVLTDSAPGVPQVKIHEAGSGDAFEYFTLSGAPVDYSTGIDAVDQNFKITGTGVLTGGVGSSQGDGITMMQANPQGIVDFDNQSRVRAMLITHPQYIDYGEWTGIEFDIDQSPNGYDQQNEFTVFDGANPGSFTPTVAGYYQVNARAEFLTDDQTSPWIEGYVSIAIYVNGTMYSQGNKLKMVEISGDIMDNNNAPNVSDVLFLSPSDTLEIRVWQTVDGTGWGLDLTMDPALTYVSIHKLS